MVRRRITRQAPTFPRQLSGSDGGYGMDRSGTLLISSHKPRRRWKPLPKQHHRRQAVLKAVRLLGELEIYICRQSDIIIDDGSARGVRRQSRRSQKAPCNGYCTAECAQQQMRWTPRGAHLMLKVRCAAMNGTLEHDHAAAEGRACRPFRRAACPQA
jgi:hypothetical protein